MNACHGTDCVIAEFCERHSEHQNAMEEPSYVYPERTGGDCELFVLDANQSAAPSEDQA
jgi:hypothetical protein